MKTAPITATRPSFGDTLLLHALIARVEQRGIRIAYDGLPPGTPMRFDGLSITLRAGHDHRELLYYLAHSLGSCAGWALNHGGVTAVFHELRDAKASGDTARIESALRSFRAFEEQSASYGGWTLEQCGAGYLLTDYSEFFRADLEAITLFHRTGQLPEWTSFLGSWRQDIADGRRQPQPFTPQLIPVFAPRAIDVQDVQQGV